MSKFDTWKPPKGEFAKNKRLEQTTPMRVTTIPVIQEQRVIPAMAARQLSVLCACGHDLARFMELWRCNEGVCYGCGQRVIVEVAT